MAEQDTTSEENRVTTSKVVQAVEWAYRQAIEGGLGLPSAMDFAEAYRAKHPDSESAIRAMIAWQVANASMVGFGTNIGGFMTMPVTIPLDLVGTLFLQLRMVRAIAYLRGYHEETDEVKTFTIGCLLGNGFAELLKKGGIFVGQRLTANLINKIPGEALKAINKAVGMRLITKAGSTGVINLTKWVPLVGGVIGGVVDGFSTAAVAQAAKLAFAPYELHEHKDTIEGSVALV